MPNTLSFVLLFLSLIASVNAIDAKLEAIQKQLADNAACVSEFQQFMPRVK